jgi:hypothetical protein
VPVRVEYHNAIRVKTNTLGSSDTELICGRLQFDGVSRATLVRAFQKAAGIPPLRVACRARSTSVSQRASAAACARLSPRVIQRSA